MPNDNVNGRDRVLTARGLNFHLIEWGSTSAPAVLLLHGITGHARTWDDEARVLADRFHVVALDQRGHGDSDPAADVDYSDTTLAEDVAAVVDALGLRHFSVVGLSLGGRVAIAYAATSPSRVERLVVVDIGPDIAPAGRARIFGLMAAAPERFESADQAIAWLRAANPRYTEAMLRHRVAHGLRGFTDGGFGWKYDRAIREAARQGVARPRPDLWPLWKAIACPTLLVRGEESDILSDEIAQQMMETQPLARLAVVAGAGHTVPADQPDAFMKLLTEFLGES